MRSQALAKESSTLASSEVFSSVQDGIYELGKAHMRSAPSLRNFPRVACEPVPMLVWLTMALYARVFHDFELLRYVLRCAIERQL